MNAFNKVFIIIFWKIKLCKTLNMPHFRNSLLIFLCLSLLFHYLMKIYLYNWKCDIIIKELLQIIKELFYCSNYLIYDAIKNL